MDSNSNSYDLGAQREEPVLDSFVEIPDIERSLPGAAPEMPHGNLTAGAMLLNRYKVVSALGKGGMGIVYKCFDDIAVIEVAVKTLAPELSGSMWEMESIRENFKLVHNLHHPNIASYNTLERDNTNGIYYLVMEYVNGVDLRYFLRNQRKSGNFSEQSVLNLIMQIADALDYAHSRKVLHRDIKPGNIMVDREGMVKLLDFGLAAEIQNSMSRVSMQKSDLSGTLPYISPEQWRGKVQTAASDQYALAVAVYEIFAGHPPFDNPDAMILRECVLNEEADVISDVSGQLWDALKRALSKNPAERFANCREFVSAMRGETIGKNGNSSKQEQAANSAEINNSGAQHPLLRRAKLFLENEEYRKAIDFCEQTLNQEPENPWAYLYRLLGELELQEPQQLVRVKTLGMQKSFRLAYRFADETLRSELETVFAQQQSNFTDAGADEAYNAAADYSVAQEQQAAPQDTARGGNNFIQQYENDVNQFSEAEAARIAEIYRQAQTRIEMLQYYRQLLEMIPGKSGECKQIEVLIANEQKLLNTKNPSDSYASQVFTVSRDFCRMVGTIDELRYDIEHGVSAKLLERKKIRNMLVMYGFIVLFLLFFIVSCAINNKKSNSRERSRRGDAVIEKAVYARPLEC